MPRFRHTGRATGSSLRETHHPGAGTIVALRPNVFANANHNEEDFMPATTGRTKRSEKGLLTPDNCVVTLIDHQPQMLFGVAGVDRQSIINNTVALGQAARVFDVPAVLSTGETKGFHGNLDH